jgi:hypothetical protein
MEKEPLIWVVNEMYARVLLPNFWIVWASNLPSCLFQTSFAIQCFVLVNFMT